MTFTLGHYTLIEPIAQGGAGEVWRGRHEALGLDVAVKLLLGRHASDEGWRRALRQEIRLVARLGHPAIVRVFDTGVVPAGLPIATDSPYLVMELATQGTLAERPPDPSWHATRALLRVLLDALAHSHARGIIHRDVKPGNVLVDPSWPLGVKLSDFGIGTRIAADSPVSGTPAYMAPEQSTGGIIGPWSDLYSLGCLAWQLTTGAPPFLGASNATTILAHQQPLPRFRPLFPVPDGLEAWLTHVLAKSPASRLRSAAEAAVRLSALAEVAPGTTRPPTDAESARVAVAPTLAMTLPWTSEGAPPIPVELDTPSMERDQVPWVPDWRGSAWFPAALRGAGLSLFGLRDTPLVGREALRDQLWAHLGEVTAAGPLRVVSVCGAEGQGKTRLCRWLCERAAELDLATPLWIEHHPDRGLGLFVEQLLGGQDPKRALRTLRIQYGDGIDPEVVRALCQPSQPMAERRTALTRLIEAMARVRPVLLVIDEAASQDDAVALTHALRELPELRILVLVCDEATDLALIDHEVHLDPMTPREIHHLIEAMLGIHDGLTSVVQNRARGNPGVVELLVQHWIQQGQLVPGPSGFRLASGAPPTVPKDLTAAWSDRLMHAMEGLDDAAWIGIQIAAVLGHHVDPDEWLACGQGSQAGLDALVEAGLLHVARHGWDFAHPLVVATILDRAAQEGRLEAHHRTCARAVRDPERHAVHLFQARSYSDCLVALVVAIRAEQSGPRRSVALLDLYDQALDALEVDDDDARRAHVLHRRINVALSLGNRSEAQRCIDRLRAHRHRAGWAGPATWALVYQAMLSPGYSPQKLKRLEAAWIEARDLPRGDLHANLERMLASTLVRMGRHTEADHWIQQALSIQAPPADETVDPMTRLFIEIWDAAKAPNLMSYIWRDLADLRTQQRRPREAVAAAQRALAFPNQRLETQSYAMVQLGKAYRMMGDLKKAEATLVQVTSVHAMPRAWASMEIAILHLIRGDFAAARRQLHGTLQQVARFGQHEIHATALLVDTVIAAGLADWDGYDRSIEQATSLLRKLDKWDVDVDIPDLARRARDMAADHPARAAAAEALLAGPKAADAPTDQGG